MPHVKQAEAREVACFHQALVEELLLDLAKLRGLHFRAVGGEFALGLRTESYEFFFGCGAEEGGEKFFFEDGEGAIEVVEGDGGGAHGGGEFGEALGRGES